MKIVYPMEFTEKQLKEIAVSKNSSEKVIFSLIKPEIAELFGKRYLFVIPETNEEILEDFDFGDAVDVFLKDKSNSLEVQLIKGFFAGDTLKIKEDKNMIIIRLEN